ncbi:hypothetical protein [Paraburkholderia caffeinilytica]|uniref:hypothetical protein n=1 Tax=Paraburkholderia caffeinilytica TaxID=1761016 RepID=UPI003DA19F78
MGLSRIATLSGQIGSVGLYQCAHKQVHGWQVVVVTSPVDGFVEVHPGQTTILKPDKRRANCLVVPRPEAAILKDLFVDCQQRALGRQSRAA